MKIASLCFKVMQVFAVTGLFAGQHNTKLTIVGSALLYTFLRINSPYLDYIMHKVLRRMVKFATSLLASLAGG